MKGKKSPFFKWTFFWNICYIISLKIITIIVIIFKYIVVMGCSKTKIFIKYFSKDLI